MMALALAAVLTGAQTASTNPWIEEWRTPYAIPPFERLAIADYPSAIAAGIAAENAEIKAIAANPEPATFANTIAPFDRAGALLFKAQAAFNLLMTTERTDAAVAAQKQVIPLLSAHEAEIIANRALFARIEAINRDKANALKTPEEREVFKHVYRRFFRGGATLDDVARRRFHEISTRLSELSLEYGNRLNLANKQFESRLGIHPSRYYEVLAAEPDRARREKLFKGYNQRGAEPGPADTREIAAEMLRLRLERAKMLGFASSADYQIEARMAGTAAKADEFIAPVVKVANAAFRRQVALFQTEMDKDIAAGKLPAGAKVEGWDYLYYATRVKKQKYALDENELKPYFTLDNVLKGVFLAAKTLYGVNMERLENVPTHHAGETAVYRVTRDDGSLIGIFYTDYRLRGTKDQGAWMDELRTQHHDAAGRDIRPIVINVANVEEYLTPDDVGTLFHEFGHALHGLLSECTYATVAGTASGPDYSEIFSQFNENWAFQPWLLKQYAIDPKTGKTIPPELIERLQQLQKFNNPFTVAEYIASAVVDLRLHELTKLDGLDVRAFEERVLREEGFPPQVVPRHRCTCFHHLFMNGYWAGYYVYLWAEVMDHDIFSVFEESGDVWNRDLATRFRDTFLKRGGSEDPMTLVRRFLGREPNSKAYFRAKGL